MPGLTPTPFSPLFRDWLVATHRSFRGSPPTSAEEAYDRAAPIYGAVHWCWLRLAGAGAERELLRAVSAATSDDDEVLDAGSGTGRLARRVIRMRPRVRLTMVDASSGMLGRAGDVPGRRMRASVLDLPFDDGSFSTVMSAWVLETVPDPDAALEQYARVLAPGGRLVYCFSSRPAGAVRLAMSAPTRHIVEKRFAGSFLPRDPLIPARCREIHRYRSRGQLATTVVLQKRPAPRETSR